MATRLKQNLKSTFSADSMLDRRSAVGLIVALCTPAPNDRALLRDRVRKMIDYAIQKKRLPVRENGVVRLGDVARVFSKNPNAAQYGAILRDISDVIPQNEATGNGSFAAPISAGVSFPADRAGVVAIALKSMERIAVLERQLHCCLAAADRRATIAEQKRDRQRLRGTLNDPVSTGPSVADLSAVFARPLKKSLTSR